MPLNSVEFEPTVAAFEVGAYNKDDPIHPFYFFYDYSISFYMYTAAEMGAAKTLTSIAINYLNDSGADESADNLSFYLMHSTSAQFESTMTVGRTNLAHTNRTLVWSGSLTVPDGTNGWIFFPLSTPFNYNGTDKLVVEARNNDGTYVGGATRPAAATSLHGQASQFMWWNFKDVTFPDDTETGTTSATERLIIGFTYTI